MGTDAYQRDLGLMRAVAEDDDHAAFGRIYGIYKPLAMHRILRHVPNRAIAEELAQDLFLVLYRYRRKFYHYLQAHPEKGSLAAAFPFLAKQVVCAHFERFERRYQYLRIDAVVRRIPDSAPLIVQQLIKALIWDVVDRLPENERLVIRMFYEGEMRAADIGRKLGMSADKVRHTLVAARQRIRDGTNG